MTNSQQSSPIEQAAEDYSKEYLKPEEKWNEVDEIEFQQRKSAFIAGSQWQAKQGDDTKKFIHEDGKTKTPYPIYPNEIRDEESSLGRFKGEPTPVKGDAYTKEEVSKAFEAGQSYEFWLQTRNALEEKDVPLAHDAYMRSLTPKAAPKGDDVKSKETIGEFIKWLETDRLFFVDEVRLWLRQYDKEEISFSRFVELFNEKVFKYAYQFAAPQAVKWLQAGEIIKELIPMAEDGLKLHISNACHQEFISEDRDVLDKAKKWLEGSTDKNETTQS